LASESSKEGEKISKGTKSLLPFLPLNPSIHAKEEEEKEEERNSSKE